MSTDNFVKTRKHEKAPKTLAKGTGGINSCWKPARDAEKADLREYHKEDLKLRRAKQRAIKGTFDWSTKATKNNDPKYRKN